MADETRRNLDAHEHRYYQFATFHRAPIADPFPAHTAVLVFLCYDCGDWYLMPEENGQSVRPAFLAMLMQMITLTLRTVGSESHEPGCGVWLGSDCSCSPYKDG